jgi:hypothetical protein
MSSADASLDLDQAIRQLLDQQADIQARLAALIATQHGFNPPIELDMLRHKLLVLENVAEHRGTLHNCLTSSPSYFPPLLFQFLGIGCASHFRTTSPRSEGTPEAPKGISGWSLTKKAKDSRHARCAPKMD